MRKVAYTYIPAQSWRTSAFAAPNARRVITTDTEYYWNNPIVQIDTTGSYLLDQVMPADSGYWFGNNVYNFSGFAELYDINRADTDTTIVQLLGVVSAWHGHVKKGSTNIISFRVWDQDPTAYFQGDTVYVKGYPGNIKTSLNWSVSQLLIGAPGAPDTTPVVAMFPYPLNSLPDHFFVGYEMTYNFNTLNGDTITLGATPEGNAKGVGMNYIDSATGNLIYIPRNAIEIAPNIWQDCYYNYGFRVNLGIVPIVQFKYAHDDLNVKGITKNELTFFGNYPNPATASTNIKFALKNTAGISVKVIDMQGRVVSMINAGALSVGDHSLPLSTENMPAGNYVYVLSTNAGAAFAGMLSVIR